MKKDFRFLIPHLAAILIFTVVSAFFSGSVFQGDRLKTHDYSVYQAVSKEKTDYEDEHDRIVLWTNSMFGGMPTYVIATPKQENIFDKIYHYLLFAGFIPFNYIFWYFMGFYILMLVFKIDPWLSVFGALSFGLSSYLFIIIAAGHFTKAVALGFMAPVFGGVYLTFSRKKPWAGMMLMAFFLTLQILSNHVQIVYYTFLIAFIYAIFEFVNYVKEKAILRFLKFTAILILGAFIAVAINSAFILTTNEYLPYSIRGKSELSTAVEDRTTGLDKSYATQWSYGIDETLTLLIPNVKGGFSGAPLSEDSETYKTIERVFGAQAAKQVVKSMPMYFGAQPFTSGPVYVGAFIILLFVFGLFVVKGRLKWWLLFTVIISILLAWGKNFMWFSDIFFDYFPYYNKFRAVAMILVIAEFAIPLLAILALKEVVSNKFPKEKLLNWFYVALGSTALITMIYIIAPSIGGVESVGGSEYNVAKEFSSYIPSEHAQMKADFERSFVEAIHNDRLSMVKNDALRSLFFIILGAAALYLLITKKIKATHAIAAMTIIVVIDMAMVNKRYLNEENFTAKRNFEKPYLPSVADNIIMADSEDHYRVLNLAVNTFNDGSTSMFHKSIGGYSGAKIRRYQELFDSIMWRDFADYRSLINAGFQNGFDEIQVQDLIDIRVNSEVLNMLNTKYIIFHPEAKPIINNKRYGNAWLVNNHVVAQNADEEIHLMMNSGKESLLSEEKISLRNTAIINKAFQNELESFSFKIDTNAYVNLKEYAPDYLIYEFKADTDQMVVFSEIYYPKGWTASINGNSKSHFRVNYVLRAMIVPAGEHIIEFRFEPESYKLGVLISYITAITLLLLIAGRIYLEYRKKQNTEV